MGVRRGLAGAALLLAGLGTPAGAQPLLPSSSPVMTLLKRQELERPMPLLPQDATGTGAAPCERLSAGAATRDGGRSGTTSLAYSGAGPGAYGRYMPGATSDAAGDAAGDAAAARTSAPAYPDALATRTAGRSGPGASAMGSGTPVAPRAAAAGAASGKSGTDRPLYGGLDRPLWQAAPRDAELDGPAATSERPSSNGLSANGGGSTANASPSRTKSLPLQDRPLWKQDAPEAAAVPVKPCLERGSPASGRIP